MLVLDGAYAVTESEITPQFHWIDHLSDQEVADLVKTIAIRIVRYLKRQGHFRDDSEYLAEDSAPEGEITYRLKKPYSDGTTHLIFSPREFMEKLAALVPRPRRHLVRYHGCLGPHAKIRSLIVPEKPNPASTAKAPQPNTQPKPRPRIQWVELLARVFAIDMKACLNCGGDFKPIAAILETKVIVRILDHLGLPSKPPPIAPARLSAAFEHCQA